MDNPLVSIITPSFNQAKFLEETILSVLNQTYKNIEYFVMDGGSTDGSIDIIKKYDSQINYWQSKADKGQADAINQAFDRSKGKIIAFLNSDDLLMPTAVESAVRCFEVNPNIGFVHGKCATIDETGTELREPEGESVSLEWAIDKGMLPRVFQPACFFNRSRIERSYFLDSSLQYTFDYDLILYLLKESFSFFINKQFASYRIHEEAKSQNVKDAFQEKLQVQLRYMNKTSPKWIFRKAKSLFMQNKKALR